MSVDVHGLSDEAFTHRQRVRRVFRTIDRDNNGTVEKGELSHLLVLLGIRVSPYELGTIFNYLDADGSGCITFDEFYSWYTTPPKTSEHIVLPRPRTAPERRPRFR